MEGKKGVEFLEININKPESDEGGGRGQGGSERGTYNIGFRENSLLFTKSVSRSI